MRWLGVEIPPANGDIMISDILFSEMFIPTIFGQNDWEVVIHAKTNRHGTAIIVKGNAEGVWYEKWITGIINDYIYRVGLDPKKTEVYHVFQGRV
jgi:hypothetical protein